nr:Methyltransferase-related protein [Ipomoea batatas]GME10887.1 Methyltransferase-related protein [Ipomoea batatas]
MCPLRIILIFLSATLAGFFVLRSLKSQPDAAENDVVDNDSPVKAPSDTSSSNSVPLCSKVCGMIGNGFWTCVDMASGKYLWRHLASSSNMKRTE